MSAVWALLIVGAAALTLSAYVRRVVGDDPEAALRAINEWTAEMKALRANIHGGDKCPRGRKGCTECATARAEFNERGDEIRAEIPTGLWMLGAIAYRTRWFLRGRS
jgi:hypothetical protein